MRPLTTGSEYVSQIDLEIDERSERIQGAYGVNCKLVRSYKPAPS
jgi:hypothetical protein